MPIVMASEKSGAFKSMKYSTSHVIRTSLKYFMFGNNKKTLMILVLFMLTLTKNSLQYISLKTYDSLGSYEPSIFHILLLKILVYRLGTISANFMTDFVFEKYLASYGGLVATTVLNSMLYSNKYSNMNATGSSMEFYISEGSKALAKISRYLLHSSTSKMMHIVIDLSFIYQKDETKKKITFFAVLLGSVVFSSLKSFLTKRALPTLAASNDMAFAREKQYAETMDMMPIVKSYRCEDSSVVKYRAKSKFWEHAWLWFKYLTLLNETIYNILVRIFCMLLAAYHVYTHPGSDLKSLVLVLMVMEEVIKTASNVVKIYTNILESVAVTEQVLDKLSDTDNFEGNIPVKSFNRSIEARGLTYASRGRVIFSDVNFTLKKGDKAALYGRNGIGKSSIFKVLMNYDGYTGSVLFDGTDSRHFLMTDYRSLITYVPQDTKLFDDTIYGNLAFGNGRTYEEIVRESKRMKVHEKIMLLPNGYNTVVGEGGKNLNGGLRQKIFYTRAFLRDTPIYLFDEPTNNLDPVNSEFLLEYIGSAEYAEKTFLVICHDMQIVEQFPKIYKFSDENIILKKGN